MQPANAVGEKCGEVTQDHITALHDLTTLLATDNSGVLEPVVRAIYHGEGGDWWGVGLWKDADFAAQVCDAPAGVTLALHEHVECREMLIVIRGQIRVIVDGVSNIYRAGDCAEFAPGQAHRVTTLEATRVLAVTIPPEADYPPGTLRSLP